MSLLAVEAAYRRVLAGAEPVARTERLPLREARGRVLADDLRSRRTQPGFDASAMDGYAVRARDAVTGAELAIVGEAAAGHGWAGSVGPGEALRIFTGAPVPEGADAVLIQEDTERLAGSARIKVTDAATAGDHIRRAGVDFAEGGLLCPAGTVLSAGAIALAASGDHSHLTVRARPRIAILATGDELVLPGEPIGPHQIVASNTFGLAALAEQSGGTVLDCGIAADDEAEIGARFDEALQAGADVFVTIGGASVGDHDLVGKVFEAKGVELDFWKVAMRPGKPFMAGRKGPMRIAGLPGNPASSLVAATLFLAPLIRRLSGLPDRPLYREGVLADAMPANGPRANFVRAIVAGETEGRPRLTALGKQDSSLLSVYARADALLMRPVNAAPARAGEPCLYVPLD
ncbi:gephyrin-like molybdotransferase Glp [Fulvimarina sp. 2208YS6-2-32]|uniref:Molybdopterin molybdenumtransferase n=1 Tax=Fulvimarina uroteuthidis TaxID=3098149 RepID=A0ABU5HZV8_9HYPH|nr:gephyrin-like molybdotransferase Glp [Fulvimarina sp. 2208YS6-2-32]MDY8108664.1 gephyrin-like molybdotransferase Glp [Fulvimarina sp. 2208YS6-2-32]